MLLQSLATPRSAPFPALFMGMTPTHTNGEQCRTTNSGAIADRRFGLGGTGHRITPPPHPHSPPSPPFVVNGQTGREPQTCACAKCSECNREFKTALKSRTPRPLWVPVPSPRGSGCVTKLNTPAVAGRPLDSGGQLRIGVL